MMMQHHQQHQQPYPLDPMAVAAYHGMYGMPMPNFHPPFPPPPPGKLTPQGYPPQQMPYAPHLAGYPQPPFPYPLAPPPQQGVGQSQQPAPAAQLPRPVAQQPRLSSYRTIGKQERPPKRSNSNNSKVQRSIRPPMKGKAPSIPHPQSSSVDASDSPPQKAPKQTARRYSSGSRNSSSDPPPPPLSQHHGRTDSIGSLSSLGSSGAGNELDLDEGRGGERRGHNRTISSGSGFLDMIRKWSPRRDNDASNFHRRNQEFLRSNSGSGRALIRNSPNPQHNR